MSSNAAYDSVNRDDNVSQSSVLDSLCLGVAYDWNIRILHTNSFDNIVLEFLNSSFVSFFQKIKWERMAVLHMVTFALVGILLRNTNITSYSMAYSFAEMLAHR